MNVANAPWSTPSLNHSDFCFVLGFGRKLAYLVILFGFSAIVLFFVSFFERQDNTNTSKSQQNSCIRFSF